MNLSNRKLTEGILFTDQYQLTMAQLYYRMGLHNKKVQFDYFFRKNPDYGSHQAGYCINAGLEWLVDWMQEVRFGEEEIALMQRQIGQAGKPLFADDFLDWLKKNGSFEDISIRSILEGRVVHPNVPIAIVQGPMAMAQLLESSLLNHLNYQTLVATKAARIHEVGDGRLMLEFGMRRAQDKGANAGARAAMIGGADFTSNAGISHLLGYPPKGTHAHSMVQIFMALSEGELGAFRAYADVYPDDCLLLVDTINTLESGIPNAIKVFEELRRKGHKPVGIRLDSGDLAYLSIQAAKMLNKAGFEDVSIVLSNQLDEIVIWQIITQIREESPRHDVDPDHLIGRLVYGVGTRLVTSEGYAALDGVYKLVAVNQEGKWLPAIKISETPEKTINPGEKQVWRIYNKRNKAMADLIGIGNEDLHNKDKIILHHPVELGVQRVIHQEDILEIESLLVDILKGGKIVYNFPSIEHIRELRKADLNRLDAGVKRIINPHIYHVSLTQGLWDLKQGLIKEHQR